MDIDTANTTFSGEGMLIIPRQIAKIGDIPVFTFPWADIPSVKEPIRTDDNLEMEKPIVPEGINVLELAKKYYKEHKQILLKRYRGKYIAIFDDKVVGSDKDFSKLARKVYGKHGYRTIYMPLVDAKEKTVSIPSPRVEAL